MLELTSALVPMRSYAFGGVELRSSDDSMAGGAMSRCRRLVHALSVTGCEVAGGSSAIGFCTRSDSEG